MKLSDPKKSSSNFHPITPNVPKHISFVKSCILVPESTGLDKWKWVFSIRSGLNLHKSAQNGKIYNSLKIVWALKNLHQFSPNHSKCSRITFYSSKAAFCYLNQPDRTSGSGFFAQIGVKLAQKCSERWDLQLCENFLTPKKIFPNFHPITTPKVPESHSTHHYNYCNVIVTVVFIKNT